MAGRLTMSFIDEDKEVASASFNGLTLNAANLDAQYALQDDLRTAVAGITLMQNYQYTRVADIHLFSKVPPTDKAAQRECKCLVQYEDNFTFRQYGVEIPGFDLATKEAGKPTVDLTAGVGLALKTAFEAYVQSPTGHSVTVKQVIHIGRRN